jgi:hypothetical protein
MEDMQIVRGRMTPMQYTAIQVTYPIKTSNQPCPSEKGKEVRRD